MTDRSRRTILCGTAGLVALSAGCLDEAGVADDGNGPDDPNGTDSENGTDDRGAGGNGDEDDTDTASGDGDGESEAIDTVSFSSATGPDSEPDAALFVSPARATDWLDDRGLDDERLTAFVDETDFERSVIVALAADAPNACYELTLEERTLGDEETDADLDLEAVVSDESTGEMGCAQVVTLVGQLVRAPIADGPTVSVTIVDRHGEEHQRGMAADSESESAAADSENESATAGESDTDSENASGA
ncbi:hypothetical protein [Haloterrigena salinisoli]|uniref:hypothetical protein n=1 Tax=Haloterrigena salinisoli TaxID=3132747 RepID=UPI0030CE0EAE